MDDENTPPKNKTTCSVCKTTEINDTLNASKLCKLCRQKEQRLNLKRKPLDAFDFQRGCFDALSTNECKEDMEHHALGARFLKTKPVKFSFEKKKKGNNYVVVTGLFNNENINMLRAAGIDFAQENIYYDAYSCGIRLSEENEVKNRDTHSENNTTPDALSKVYPKIDTLLGPYVEMDPSVTALISQDFRLKPELLPEIAELFTGSIVSYKDDTLLLITTEVYSRFASLDAHAENEYYVSSLPVKDQTKYDDLFFGTVLSADGKKTKTKLEIGTTTANLLITSSISLDKSQRVFIGPETGIAFDPKETSVYLIKSKVDRLKDLEDKINAQKSIDLLRQVTSGFYSPTTYAPYRRTLSSFDDLIHKPATVFTLCDLPNNGGYGSNDGSYSRCASHFFQMLAVAAVGSSGSLTRTNFDFFEARYDLQKSDGANWKTLGVAVKSLGDFFEEGDNINIYKFTKNHNLSDAATGISSGLTSANAKIKENIVARFRTLYY